MWIEGGRRAVMLCALVVVVESAMQRSCRSSGVVPQAVES